jgi:putative transposase
MEEVGSYRNDNVQEDHVHVMLSIFPKFSVSEVIGFLKGRCAIKIIDKHLELKRRYWGRHFGTKGYCVSTVGLDEEKIRQYVTWQQIKAKKINQNYANSSRESNPASEYCKN